MTTETMTRPASFNDYIGLRPAIDELDATIRLAIKNNWDQWPKRHKKFEPYETALEKLAGGFAVSWGLRLASWWDEFQSLPEASAVPETPKEPAAALTKSVIPGHDGEAPAFSALLADLTTKDIEWAALKACKLDEAPKEQQIVAMALANRYRLDIFAGQVCMVDGALYIRHRGLLHIAHEYKGVFKGIRRVGKPTLETYEMPSGTLCCWECSVEVFRSDMDMPFEATGRCWTFDKMFKNSGPEMAETRAEVRALRKAFDIAIPGFEELAEARASAQPGMKDAEILGQADRVEIAGAVTGAAAPARPAPVLPPTSDLDPGLPGYPAPLTITQAELDAQPRGLGPFEDHEHKMVLAEDAVIEGQLAKAGDVIHHKADGSVVVTPGEERVEAFREKTEQDLLDGAVAKGAQEAEEMVGPPPGVGTPPAVPETPAGKEYRTCKITSCASVFLADRADPKYICPKCVSQAMEAAAAPLATDGDGQ